MLQGRLRFLSTAFSLASLAAAAATQSAYRLIRFPSFSLLQNPRNTPIPIGFPCNLTEFTAFPDEVTVNADENESYDNQSSPVKEFQQGNEIVNFFELRIENEPVMHQEETGQNLKELESKEQHYAPRRSYTNYRGGRGMGMSGRRGYPNGRGGRGSSREGTY